MVCANGTFTRSSGRISEITALNPPKNDSSFNILYPADNTFSLDINGFGGPSFAPTQKATGPTFMYDYFQNGTDELELYRNRLLTYVTFGRYSDAQTLCFFAAGGPPKYAPFGNVAFSNPYVGLGDGMARIAGSTLRLLESSASASVNYPANTVDITLSLRGRTTAFGEPSGAFTPVETVTGTVPLSSLGSFNGSLTGPDGLSGTVQGNLFDMKQFGMVLTYSLRRPNGDIYFGAAGLDLNVSALPIG